MAIISNTGKIQCRVRVACRLIHYCSLLGLLVLFIHLFNIPGVTRRQAIARKHRGQEVDAKTSETFSTPANRNPKYAVFSRCPRGYFSFPERNRCRPWLNCTEISYQVRREEPIGRGFRKKVYSANWNGHRVVYSRCSWMAVSHPDSIHPCLHGIEMMELLQGEFVTRLFGVCHETLEVRSSFLAMHARILFSQLFKKQSYE